MISVLEGDYLRPPSAVDLDFSRKDILVTFDGLIRQTPFVRQIAACLHTLEEGLKCPVDIEFASDGQHLYLLQCRPQSQGLDLNPSPIPSDVPPNLCCLRPIATSPTAASPISPTSFMSIPTATVK